MRRVVLEKGRLVLTHKKIEGFMERIVTRLGTSGKVDCPKRFIGKRAYLIICKD